jgi:hypothetical protein
MFCITESIKGEWGNENGICKIEINIDDTEILT